MERVLLLGYFGAGNFGDDALLAAWLATHQRFLQQRGAIADVVSSGRDPLEGFVEGQTLMQVTGRFIPKREALSAPAAEYHALLAPGGSLLQDATSLRSLLYYLEMTRRFALARRPVYLLNQGMGPLRSLTARIVTPFTLRSTRMLSFRDRDSFDWAQRQLPLHGHRELHLSADPLLAPVFEYSPEIENNEAYRGGYVLAIPKAGSPLGSSNALREAQQLARLIRAACTATGAKALLLPLHAGQDEPFCHSVRDALGEPVEVFGATASVRFRSSALFTLIARATLVISHRLHGLVCAAAYGVPAFGIAYDPKISAFCEEIGYPYCHPLRVDSQPELERVAQLWQGRQRAVERLGIRRERMLIRRREAEERFYALW